MCAILLSHPCGQSNRAHDPSAFIGDFLWAGVATSIWARLRRRSGREKGKNADKRRCTPIKAAAPEAAGVRGLCRMRGDALSRCAAGARSFGLAAISLSDTHGVIAAVSNIPHNCSGSSESRCTAPTQTRASALGRWYTRSPQDYGYTARRAWRLHAKPRLIRLPLEVGYISSPEQDRCPVGHRDDGRVDHCLRDPGKYRSVDGTQARDTP